MLVDRLQVIQPEPTSHRLLDQLDFALAGPLVLERLELLWIVKARLVAKSA